MTKDEALKMAIKALEQYVDVVGNKFNAETWGDIEDKGNPAREAINACKEALEQPTIAELNDEYLRDTYVVGLNQPAWQGLTDDEIEYWECLKAPPVHPDFLEDDSWREFARCIEKALKDKNT